MTTPPPEAARPGAERGPWRRWGGLAAGVLVFAFLGWALVDGWSAVSEYDWDVDPGLLALGCLTLLVFYLASGLGYRAVIDELHAPALPARTTLSIWGRSLLGRYVPGSVVMIVGRVVLSYERGVPRTATLAAMAYEQLLSVGVAAAGGVAFIALYGAADGDAGGDGRVWLLALLPLGLLALHPRVFGPASSWLLRRARRAPLPRLLEGRVLTAVLAWYAGTAVLLGIGVWLVVRAAAGAEAGGPGFVGLAFLLSFAISMVAVIFPSGLGIREGAFALALAQNVPGGVAVALAVGSRLVLTLVELVFVALVWLAGRDR